MVRVAYLCGKSIDAVDVVFVSALQFQVAHSQLRIAERAVREVQIAGVVDHDCTVHILENKFFEEPAVDVVDPQPRHQHAAELSIFDRDSAERAHIDRFALRRDIETLNTEYAVVELRSAYRDIVRRRTFLPVQHGADVDAASGVFDRAIFDQDIGTLDGDSVVAVVASLVVEQYCAETAVVRFKEDVRFVPQFRGADEMRLALLFRCDILILVRISDDIIRDGVFQGQFSRYAVPEFCGAVPDDRRLHFDFSGVGRYQQKIGAGVPVCVVGEQLAVANLRDGNSGSKRVETVIAHIAEIAVFRKDADLHRTPVE